MADFRPAGDEEVNVFLIDELYLFKHYFEDEEIFERLKEYYNPHQYRFEVPPPDFAEIRTFLQQQGYGLVVIDPIEDFAVLVKKYTDHPDNIFRASVIQRSVDGYNCFVMTDQAAVNRAVKEGAIHFTQADFDSPF